MGYALDLLNAEDGIERPLVTTLYNPVIFSGLGFGFITFANYMSRKPLLAGIQRHFLSAGIGLALGLYVNKKRDEYYAERDAVLRHYVELHPEDFPDPERKKFGEIFTSWTPIR